METTKIAVFRGKEIRKTIHNNEWWFSVVDVIAALTDSENPAVYWRVLKKRLKDEGADQTVTKCNALKMPSADGKMRLRQKRCSALSSRYQVPKQNPSNAGWRRSAMSDPAAPWTAPGTTGNSTAEGLSC